MPFCCRSSPLLLARRGYIARGGMCGTPGRRHVQARIAGSRRSTLARQGGLEPPTLGLEIRRSIPLSYWRARTYVIWLRSAAAVEAGTAAVRGRTGADPFFTRPPRAGILHPAAQPAANPIIACYSRRRTNASLLGRRGPWSWPFSAVSAVREVALWHYLLVGFPAAGDAATRVTLFPLSRTR